MRIVFIADEFADDFIGGSELSIQVHIDTCYPYKYIKIKSNELRLKDLRADDFLVFGNFYNLDKMLMPEIASKFKYVIEECDYKYCRFRSSHLHKFMKGECDCPTTYSPPIIELFLGAKHIFWKSERQREEYYRIFPELEAIPSDIVSGVFSDKQLDLILSLKDTPQENKYFILRTGGWVKGYREAIIYCNNHGLDYVEIQGLPYEQSLKEMAKCKGIVYMPNGFDVSCRMITEMKLMGREIITNDRVQHTTEEWFNAGEEKMLEFLRGRNKMFWERINAYILA
jgi:hypothetical protein